MKLIWNILLERVHFVAISNNKWLLGDIYPLSEHVCKKNMTISRMKKLPPALEKESLSTKDQIVSSGAN